MNALPLQRGGEGKPWVRKSLGRGKARDEGKPGARTSCGQEQAWGEEKPLPLRGGGSWRWDQVVAEVVFDGGVVNTLHVMGVDLTYQDLEEVLEEVGEGLLII